MKRVLDGLLAAFLLVLLSPLWVVLTVLVKGSSPGPVFFAQKRVGKDGAFFQMLKFRTMKVDTPDVATHLLENPEQYVTGVGKVLRKTSLDELPQLWNILRGDMSFVGPRPALYNQEDLIALREEKGVNRLVPGLTGWAQINGRDELAIPDKVAYDTYYLQHQSLRLDLKIMALTFVKVIKREGIR